MSRAGFEPATPCLKVLPNSSQRRVSASCTSQNPAKSRKKSPLPHPGRTSSRRGNRDKPGATSTNLSF